MSIQPQPALELRENWVTPREQLRRLASSLVKKRLYADRKELSDTLVDKITEIAIESILKRSDLAEDSVPMLSDQLVERLVPSNLTNWYTSLDRLNALPPLIPPLPWNIHQVLNGKCPIRSEERKPDGSTYKVGETHVLYLDPFPTIEDLEEKLSAYGQQHYPDKNPLRFRYFWHEALPEPGNAQSNRPQWLLMSNDVLPGSRNKSYKSQVQMVKDLSDKALVKYEVPSLKAAIAVLFLHKVATKESLYQAANNQNGNVTTYTRVQEAIRKWRLIVGGFAPGGLVVTYFLDIGNIGIAALRKL